MKLPIIVFVISLFFFSCQQISQVKTDASHLINIAFPKVIDKVRILKYSELFGSVKLVKLETTKNSLIGRIDKIIVHNGFFFILDQAEGKAVFEFNNKGGFIRKFGIVGRGPGKYNMPNDVSIIGNNLAIWVSESSKFIIYDLNGTYLKEIKTNLPAKSGTMLADGSFALYTDIGADAKSEERFNLKILNKEGNGSAVGFEKNDKEFSKGNFFFNQNKNYILVSPGYSSDVYLVNKDTIQKRYAINFGKFKMPADFPQKFSSLAGFEKGLQSSDYVSLHNYFETPRYFMFSFTYHSLIYNCFYSKKTKMLKYGNIRFNNVQNILSGVDAAVDGENVIAYYDPAGIDFYKKNYSYPLTENKINSFISDINKFYFAGRSGSSITVSDFHFTKLELANLQDIKISDNPVLLIEKLKEF